MNATTISELTRENGWAPLRAHLGARAFGINAYTKNADEQIVGEHDEEASGHEELYLVVAGRAKFTVDGEERDAPVGTAVLVPSGTTRSADALEDGTTIVVVGGRPGAVFQPRAWETNAIIFPMFGEGKIEEAREILRGVVGAVRGRRVDRVQPRVLRGAARRRRPGVRAPRARARRPAGSRRARPRRRRPRCAAGTIPASTSWSVRGYADARLSPTRDRLARSGSGRAVASSACSMRATWRSFFVSLRRLSMGFEGSPVER